MKKKQKKSKIRIFARTHAIVTVIMFVLYVGLASISDMSLLAKDLQAKYAWAESVTLSVFVEALPNQPVVVAEVQCVADQQPRVVLSWGPTAATDYFDIMRDGQMLVSGVTEFSYSDENVSVATTYEYVVIAHGSLGSVASAPVSATTSDCLPPPLPSPTCQVTSFESAPITEGVVPKTSKQTPSFSGTSNIPDAIVNIIISSQPAISSTIYANSNGYWEYVTPAPLALGGYNISITVTDPLDEGRTASDNLYFEIIAADEDEDEDGDDDGDGKKDNGKEEDGSAASPSQNIYGSDDQLLGGEGGLLEEQSIETSQPVQEPTASVRISIRNKDKTVYAGQDVFFDIFYRWKDGAPEEFDLAFEIVDSNGRVASAIRKKGLSAEENLGQKIPLPENLGFGEYFLRVRLEIGGMIVTGEDSFFHNERPLITLGGSVRFTYSDLVSRIGWIAFAMLMMLFVWMKFVMLHEYFLYRKAIIHITEKGLGKSGLISKRKEVSR